MAEETDEAAALRAENAELQRRNQELLAQTARVPAGQQAVNVLRATSVVVLLLLGAICATAAVPAIWSRNLVLNTDRYVETLTPLASDPGLQAGIVKAIDKQFADNVDVKGLLIDVLPPRAVVLAGPIESGVNSLVNTVATKFVQSDAFQTIWVQMNRVTHTALVAILTGKGGGDQVLAVKNGELILDIGPVVEQVKTLLVDAGLTIASKVPSVGATFVVAQVKGVESARTYVRMLDRTADLLPVLAAVLIAVGVVVSKHRRRTLIIAALSIAGGMLVLGVGLAIARTVLSSTNLPGIYIDRATASGLFDTRGPLPARRSAHRVRGGVAGRGARLVGRAVPAGSFHPASHRDGAGGA